MFADLAAINVRPEPFEFYTAQDLWTDEYTAKQMLSFHLNDEVDLSSRRSSFVERSVEWMVSEFGLGHGKRVADFGCGPGLYAAPLARTGAAVTGIDFSANSLAYAKEVAGREGLSIDYVRANYLEFEVEDRFDLILLIMCDFCALSPAQRHRLLSKFRQLLKPGGAVLFDVYSTHAMAEREEVSVFEHRLLNGFWAEGDYYGFLHTFKYEAEQVVLDKYTIVEPSRTRTVYNWLAYFSPGQLETELEQAGLSLKRILGDVAGSAFDATATEFAVVAQR